MELGLTGRTALVTGASKGIGFAAARRLALEGCNVHLAARTAADLDAAAERIRGEADVDVVLHAADLAISANITALADDCGDVDILVNNAGAIPGGSIDAVDETRWRDAWDLKVFGYINFCRLAYANMKARGKGVIVNVIGVAGERPSFGYVAGSAANAGLMALTRALGGHGPLDGVRVVAVNPGLIQTERMETLLRTNAERQLNDASRWRELLNQEFPPGQPEHIADMVAFLASDLSANTTGTVVTIDGGSSAR